MSEKKDNFQKKTEKYLKSNPPVSLPHQVRDKLFNKGGGKKGGIYRFAPSPSGYLHVGGARTAIFNWILARKENGRFLIRIEDTDQKRSSDESVQNILSSMQWLGLSWDEDPVYQSSRHERHLEVVSELVKNKKAHYCFCEKKEENQSDPCRNLSAAQVEQKIAGGNSYTVRIHIPEKDIIFKDGICGEIRVSRSELNDFIILRSDRTPIYHLAVVVDDHDMGVTHVIRGADHLLNTAKQLVIYQALGWSIPQFTHLPLILSEDKSRLSKRHGAVSVEEFQRLGILPDALFNFLCLLGWSPGNDRELVSRDEIIQLFSLDRVGSHNAIFDREKLLWMNGKYISNLGEDQIVEWIKTMISREQKEVCRRERESLNHLLKLVKIRSRTLIDIMEGISFFFSDPASYEEEGVKKYFSSPVSAEYLEKLRMELLNDAVFDQTTLETVIRKFSEQQNTSAAVIIHPLRLALTGKTFSPGIFEIMQILGKERVIRRIQKAVQYIKNNKLFK
jgi:glutamyl-tRNA synthetase